jgi:hypothetical protein
LPLHQVSESLANRTGGRIMHLSNIASRMAYCLPLPSSALGFTLMAVTAEMITGGMFWLAPIAEFMRVIA